MKFSQYLVEDYFGRLKDNEIFVNPSPKELLKEFGEGAEIRWSTDYKNKLLYVWGGDMLHTEIYEKFPKTIENCLVRGGGIIGRNGKIENEGPPVLRPEWNQPKYKHAHDFLKQYFVDDMYELMQMSHQEFPSQKVYWNFRKKFISVP